MQAPSVPNQQDRLCITPRWVAYLKQHGRAGSSGLTGSFDFAAQLIIPNYREQLCSHFKLSGSADLADQCAAANIGMPFETFGVSIRFHEPSELALFGPDAVLDAGMKHLIEEFGVVVLRNATLDQWGRSTEHRAQFKHLSFHRDRNPSQANCYSLYSRSPLCEVQYHPRKASTLFMANMAAHLQLRKEQPDSNPGAGVRAHYELFENEDLRDLIGTVVAEHAWDEPAGIGELSMLDNRTVLHSSFYHNICERSYSIGVRYVA